MRERSEEDTHRTIERGARESYGRLVAYLSSHTRDVAGAEDALSNALVAVLKAWPRDGVPQNREAWLLTTSAPLPHRSCASSASGRSERAHTPAPQGEPQGGQLVDGVSG